MLTRTNVTNIGDPFIVRAGEHYYMYATSFDVDGFKVWKSENMEEWECLGVCLDLSNSWTCQDYWAPEVIYHNGKYIMHYTARRESDKSLRLGVAVSEKPEGPLLMVLQHMDTKAVWTYVVKLVNSCRLTMELAIMWNSIFT